MQRVAAARRIQARSRLVDSSAVEDEESERAQESMALLDLALRVAKEIQNIIMEGQASRWQALHGSVKSSHGVFKLRELY